MTMTIGPVLKYPGAKWQMAAWIVSQFPEHEVYLEPFFGSGAVFFTKQPSRVETINDIDGRVVNFFRVLRERPDELVRQLELTPYARDEYDMSYEQAHDPLEDARRFAVRCFQAHGSVTGKRVGWRNDVQGKVSTALCQQWRALPERISNTAARLRGVQVEHRHAVEVIERFAFANVLIYADPPYVNETRSNKLYAYEMTDDDHTTLLTALNNHPGPVLISGYRCPLYDGALGNWLAVERRVRAEKAQERTEVLWLNEQAARMSRQSRLPLATA